MGCCMAKMATPRMMEMRQLVDGTTEVVCPPRLVSTVIALVIISEISLAVKAITPVAISIQDIGLSWCQYSRKQHYLHSTITIDS